MNHNRHTLLLALFLGAGVTLGGMAVRRGLEGWSLASGWLRDPFRMSTRTLTGPVVLERVQKLQRLETCRYQGETVVEGDTQGVLPRWLAGDRLLFLGQGEVVAGLDLSRLRPEDVRVEGSRVSLRLPPAEILSTRLDNTRSHVYERTTGFFTGPDRDLESRVRQSAEEQIRAAALQSGLLATAETNAREAMREQLGQLGFDRIELL